MSEELQQLRDIIVGSIDTILASCKRKDEDFPSLDKPALASEFESTGIRNDPSVVEASTLAIAAATQLVATLQSPVTTLALAAASYNLSACLATIERLHVPEILRSAGPNGMHVDDIVNSTGADSKKTARVLRHLATHHIFTEVAPDYYKHNLISSVLDTGKDAISIQRDPVMKYDNTNGVAALVSLLSDEGLKAGSFLSETLSNPETAHSQDPTQTNVQKALGFEGTRWDFFDKPENALSFHRYTAAMVGTTKLHTPDVIQKDFNWKEFPQDGVVIDVGCGMGNILFDIAKERPDLMFILEDRAQVIEGAKAYWTREAANFRESARLNVRFIEHDLFRAHPHVPRPADAFILRNVLRNWPDSYAKDILYNLRLAAKADTKLMIVESIIEHTCPAPLSGDLGQLGYGLDARPRPLLANLGAANALPYDMDIAMLNGFNGQERTLVEFAKLLESASWKLTEVRKSAATKIGSSLLIASPTHHNVRRYEGYPSIFFDAK